MLVLWSSLQWQEVVWGQSKHRILQDEQSWSLAHNQLHLIRVCGITLSVARFLSLARTKLRLCSTNQRPGYCSNLPRNLAEHSLSLLRARDRELHHINVGLHHTVGSIATYSTIRFIAYMNRWRIHDLNVMANHNCMHEQMTNPWSQCYGQPQLHTWTDDESMISLLWPTTIAYMNRWRIHDLNVMANHNCIHEQMTNPWTQWYGQPQLHTWTDDESMISLLWSTIIACMNRWRIHDLNVMANHNCIHEQMKNS